jgi:hypothetical protein
MRVCDIKDGCIRARAQHLHTCARHICPSPSRSRVHAHARALREQPSTRNLEQVQVEEVERVRVNRVPAGVPTEGGAERGELDKLVRRALGLAEWERWRRRGGDDQGRGERVRGELERREWGSTAAAAAAGAARRRGCLCLRHRHGRGVGMPVGVRGGEGGGAGGWVRGQPVCGRRAGRVGARPGRAGRVGVLGWRGPRRVGGSGHDVHRVVERASVRLRVWRRRRRIGRLWVVWSGDERLARSSGGVCWAQRGESAGSGGRGADDRSAGRPRALTLAVAAVAALGGAGSASCATGFGEAGGEEEARWSAEPRERWIGVDGAEEMFGALGVVRDCGMRRSTCGSSTKTERGGRTEMPFTLDAGALDERRVRLLDERVTRRRGLW